jgi:tetratricopeptide (TPR) repeat protein
MVLDELVEVFSKLDEKQAMALAEMSPFPERKALALSVIAQSLAKKGDTRGKELLDRAAEIVRQIRDPDKQASAWRSVAAAMALFDVEQALNWAKGIRDLDWRDWTLGDISATVADKSVDKALEIAQQINDPEERSSALADIAIALARSDFERAIEIARKIPDPFYRVQALCELAQKVVLLVNNDALGSGEEETKQDPEG